MQKGESIFRLWLKPWVSTWSNENVLQKGNNYHSCTVSDEQTNSNGLLDYLQSSGCLPLLYGRRYCHKIHTGRISDHALHLLGGQLGGKKAALSKFPLALYSDEYWYIAFQQQNLQITLCSNLIKHANTSYYKALYCFSTRVVHKRDYTVKSINQ